MHLYFIPLLITVNVFVCYIIKQHKYIIILICASVYALLFQTQMNWGTQEAISFWVHLKFELPFMCASIILLKVKIDKYLFVAGPTALTALICSVFLIHHTAAHRLLFVIFSIALFLYFYQADFKPLKKLSQFNKLSFGIFLIHPLFVELFKRLLPQHYFTPVLLFVLVLTASALTIYLMSRHHLLRKVIA